MSQDCASMTSPTNRTDEVARQIVLLTFGYQSPNLLTQHYDKTLESLMLRIASAITSAVEAERERCAKVAETDMVFGKDVPTDQFKGWRIGAEQAAQSIAAAIRQTPTQEERCSALE
jgi:hypothetical protein